MSGTGYHLLESALRLLRVSQKAEKSPEDLKTVLEKYKKNRKYEIPEDFLRTVCDYRIAEAGGRACIIASPFGKKPERAVLLFYGSGYYKVPHRADFEYLVKVVRQTSSEVWFPLYPLAPEADISDIMEHAAAVYRSMLAKWDPSRIVLQGNSSGGTTCLYLCMKIKRDASVSGTPQLPWPSRILLLSPAVQMPPSEKQLEAMRALENRDVVLSAKYCTSIASLLYHPDYDYLCHPFDFDWTGFPPMMVLYGTKEIFSVFLPELRAAARRYHVPVKGCCGRNMMHCWPLYGSFPEGKIAVKKMLLFISGTDDENALCDDNDMEFVCVHTARDDLEARMIENLLRDNGIPCFRQDPFNAGFMNVYGGASRMDVYICTSSDKAEEAREILMQTLG